MLLHLMSGRVQSWVSPHSACDLSETNQHLKPGRSWTTPTNPCRASEELPELAQRGSFAPEAVYTPADIKEASWGRGAAWGCCLLAVPGCWLLPALSPVAGAVMRAAPAAGCHQTQPCLQTCPQLRLMPCSSPACAGGALCALPRRARHPRARHTGWVAGWGMPLNCVRRGHASCHCPFR